MPEKEEKKLIEVHVETIKEDSQSQIMEY